MRPKHFLADLGVDIPGHKLIRELNVAAQQMVEIAKAVSHKASLILMDEPTSALSSREVDALFALMRRLKEKGVAVVFVSHRLDEVRQIVDRVIIMRDGRRVGSLPIAEATEEKIIRMMVGRDVGLFPKEAAEVRRAGAGSTPFVGPERRQKYKFDRSQRGNCGPGRVDWGRSNGSWSGLSVG